MLLRTLFAFFTVMSASTLFAQTPPIEPGVSQDLAIWRAARYSDVRYKLNLTLEKMSPVLKGTIEIRVKIAAEPNRSEPPSSAGGFPVPAIVLDWRKIKGNESLSTVSNVSINGHELRLQPRNDRGEITPEGVTRTYDEANEHLIFRDGVVAGENVIKLDFTSPILTSGSAITRYVDKEDGAEYLYSLFVPSDASTAFPVFDQPDLKARFSVFIDAPKDWKTVLNTFVNDNAWELGVGPSERTEAERYANYRKGRNFSYFFETKPISTYVFAFAAGPFEKFASSGSEPGAIATGSPDENKGVSGSRGNPVAMAPGSDKTEPPTSIYVRRSQAVKFRQHADEVFRLNREGIKFLEQYFDYKFPFPKYDLVLIPEFPFGGMEHAGATFLREDRVIFPQEPTKNDYITRANVIFHEAAHQWFGDTVTMKWFDDLWLKEGFAEFMAYKTLEKVMPEYSAWKIFYERNKQLAYLTDSTKGTTPIYQEIKNLSSAKSAYGNIAYRKAPSFLRQAEFYIGEDKFQTAVRAFLKKHEFGNAGWEDLVKEFETLNSNSLERWAKKWVTQAGVDRYRISFLPMGSSIDPNSHPVAAFLSEVEQKLLPGENFNYPKPIRVNVLTIDNKGKIKIKPQIPFRGNTTSSISEFEAQKPPRLIFPNYQDYGYGIFILDDKSRDYVLKNIQNEKDDFLRTMMWGSLWDSVREAEFNPKEYVELVIKNINVESDESTIQTLLGRVSTAMNYYVSVPRTGAGVDLSVPPAIAGGAVSTSKSPPAIAGGTDVKNAPATDLNRRLEAMLIERMRNARTLGQRITFYRAFLNIASTEGARVELKRLLSNTDGNPSGSERVKRLENSTGKNTLPTGRVSASDISLPLKTKDRFDIVTKLLILGDADAPALLAELEKSDTADEAKRYAYAAKAGIATAENKAKYWNDFTTNRDISESWIESSLGVFNSPRHSDLTLQYLERALAELPKLKRDRKIFFVNGWLSAFIGGQKSEQALAVVNKFLGDNPSLDNDLRLKILENVDLIERAVKIRAKYAK
ncbi:MAG: M1 family aminopeptidase [Acidobacteriota bacterium]